MIFAPLVQASSKYLAFAFPIVQIMWARSAGHTLWMVAVFWRSHGVSMFRTHHPGIQLARSCSLTACSALWLLAIPSVSLASAGVIMFTTPMFVALLSASTLGERVGAHRWFAVVLGFIGVVVVLRPWTQDVVWEMLLVLLAAISYAVYQLLTRRVSQSDSAATSAVYAVAVGAVIVTAILPWHFQLPQPEHIHYWIGFVAVGFLGGFRHLFMVKAFECAPASAISPFCYTELVGITALGLIIFGEIPSFWTAIGASIIVASGLYLAKAESVSDS